ncbi:Uncharacterized protein Adt_41548 [Abeliophyllum distichum]|uniref:Uncharacterized protein n=1 Tax=Abeliophyllum distichum TaxID=126358 RepID=A0ABD1PPY6_9LAMI
MLFCERITDAEALSTLKGVLDMNLPFWRDVRNKNPTTFDQLVKMITEEITNKNMVLHRNCGGTVLNPTPRAGYGQGQGRHLPPQQQRRKGYPSDPNVGMSYVASEQEGLLPPPLFPGASGSNAGAYNYGMAPSTYYKIRTSAPPVLPLHQKAPVSYCCIDRSYSHSTDECHEVENLAIKRDINSGPRRGMNLKRGDRSPMRSRRQPFHDRRSQQWDRRIAGQEQQIRRNSKSPARQAST